MKKRPSPVCITFWGTRGSIATPGRATLRFGGNTPCVEVRSGDDFLILDAGSGIRVLGLNGWRSFGPTKKPIPILITHPHMDHIVGLPFFAPALKKGRSLQIYGPRGLRLSLQRLFPFPVLLSQRRVREIGPGPFRVASFRVASRWVNHPGGALAYRITAPSGQTVVYMSDHEPADPLRGFRHGRRSPSDRTLRRWIGPADLLIMDAQYFEDEYRRCRGWGHSPVSYTVRIAQQAGVKRLVLFHHDPGHSDTTLRRKLRLAKGIIRRSGKPLACGLAREGQKIVW